MVHLLIANAFLHTRRGYCVERKILLMQVSRLIEMQTPLYVEAVQHVHPYFDSLHNESENYSVN